MEVDARGNLTGYVVRCAPLAEALAIAGWQHDRQP
jgi:hypothetical protein